jgi:putative addiction module component (TIGR02574 family)
MPVALNSGSNRSSAKSISRYNLPMQHTFEEVQQFAQELPEDQRILLANSLWESAGASEAEIAAAWEPEIARRVDEIKAGTAVTYSLAEVEADLQAVVGR